MERRRQSGIENFLTLVSKAPWPVGVGLAIGSFLVLNHIAQGEPVQGSSVSDISSTLLPNLAITLAGVARFLLPPLFLVAAIGSFVSARRNARIFAAAAAEPQHGVASLDWREFERLVTELFRKRGFTVRHTGGSGADGGVDIELKRDAELFLVQCKHWRARKVPVATVRELYGAMTAAQASGGFVVTSGEFTSAAAEFAHGRNIELLDGSVLAASLKEALPGDSVEPVVGDFGKRPDVHTPPDCPACGRKMVERTAKRGPLTGNRFWGCSDFPACRGTRKIGD